MFNRFTRFYIRENILTKEIKQELLKIFKKSVNLKNVKLNSYLKTTEYEKPVKVYHTKYEKELNELKGFKIGTKDFEKEFSSSLINIINHYYYEKYYSDIDKAVEESKGMTKKEEAYIASKVNRIVDLNIKNNFEESINEIDLDGVFSNEKIIFEEKEVNRLIEYAIYEDKLEMLEIEEDGKVKLKDEVYKKYIIDKETIPLTTKEKAKKSVNRSYQNVDNLAKANAESFKYFITLTFADKLEDEKYKKLNKERKEGEYNLNFKYVEDARNVEMCSKILHRFFDNVNVQLTKTYKLPKLKYLGVPEYQSNGNIHYHFLISEIPEEMLYQVPEWLDYDNYSKTYKNGLGIKSWLWGKSDVEEIKDKARITSYIEKYLTKDLKECSEIMYKERLNKKRFYKSNNLIKPKITYDEFIDIDNAVSVYETIKRNVFNDSDIVNKVIQLKEIS